MDSKKQKILFWAFTAPIAALMLASGIPLVGHFPQNMEGLQHLGYPLYFANLVGTAKILGVIPLVYRRFAVLTEWAYAGFTFLFLSASYSHYSSGDELAKVVMPLVILMFLFGSYKFSPKN